MEQIFLTVLNMSAAASVVIAVVLLARLLLRKAPKKWSYLLWSVVAFRLCCPVSFKSVFSVFRLKPLQGAATAAVTETARQTSTITYIPQLPAQTPAVIPAAAPAAPVTPVTPVTPISPSVPVTSSAANVAQATPTLLTTVMWMIIWLWLAAMLVLIGYSIYSYVKMRRVVDDACLVRDNIYETDRIRTPFILGLVRPRIYIPTGLQGEQLDYVLAHESCHLRRHDNIVKSFGFLLMAVHWFNPLVWLSFHLMTKDMEMSCDESVLGRREGANKLYSSALLSFAAPSHFPAATPLCFGESSVKSRIRNALSWRRPRTWVTLVAIVLCVAALAACATNPATPKPKSEAEPIHQEEPGEESERLNVAVKVSDTGHDAFYIETVEDPAMALTVQLPDSWKDRYTYEASPDYPGGLAVYCKEARADAPEGSTWGQLFTIRCIPGMYPLNFEWGYKARVLATNTDATFLMEYPDEIQSAEMVHSSEAVTRTYMYMRGQTDQVQVILSGEMQQKTYNELNWDPDTVTLYQSVSELRGAQPIFCDAATSRMLREMLTGREYVADDTARGVFDRSKAIGVLADTTYAIDMRTGAILQYNVGLEATEPLTAEEVAQVQEALNCSGYGWQMRVTDLGNDTFRIEDAGYTPGMDVTVQLPESWAGRYAYKVYSAGIEFYCKDTYEKSLDGEPRGVLCAIDVVDRMMTPDEPMYGDSRVLATAGSYTVQLLCPGDVQFTEDTAEAYHALYADRDKLKITLSDWMLSNTWNETNWVPGTITLRDYDADSKTVICDELTSAAIREMLESRTFEEDAQKTDSVTSHGLEIQCNGELYYLVGTADREGWVSGEVINSVAQFAAEPLTDAEMSFIYNALQSNGQVLQVKITDQGGDTFRLEDVGYTPGLDMTVKVPASWVGRYSYRIFGTSITFYCNAAREDELPGKICSVYVTDRMLPLGYKSNIDPVLVTARDAASGRTYSVLQGFPTDMQAGPKGQEEYESMCADLDAMVFTLSPEMESSTWNESNWVPGTVTVELDHLDSWSPVICDADASAAIRTILDSRPYQAADGLPLADHVIFVDGVQYFIQNESGSVYRQDDVYGVTRRTTGLMVSELTLIRNIVENSGTMADERMMEAMEAALAHFNAEADAGMLNERAVSYLKYIVSPDVDATVRQRENGTIGESDWAFQLTTIFVPEDPEDIRYLMAGNTHQYSGVYSSVPEGAYEMIHVGFAKRMVDGWEIMVTGTGW